MVYFISVSILIHKLDQLDLIWFTYKLDLI